MPEHLSPNSDTPQPPVVPESIHPENIASPEALHAASAIGGLGALAVEVATSDSAVAPQAGFMRRKWDSIKDAFDPRNTPAGKAIVEAGQTFSKWDLARSLAGRFIEAGKLVVSVPTNAAIWSATVGLSTDNRGRTRPNSIADKALNRVKNTTDGFASGANNSVMRRKMASALLDNRSFNNPVLAHLAESGKKANLKVTKAENRELWRRNNPVDVRLLNMLSGTAMGGVVVAAPKVIETVRHIF